MTGRAVTAACLLAASVACGGETGEGGARDGAPGDTGRTRAAESGSPASEGAAPAAGAAADTAGAGAGASEEDPRPLRTFRVRLWNRSGDTLVAVADAGAGTRTLDTLPPADSSEVRVETRAGLLEIRAVDGAGREAARARYDLERSPGDTLLEFEAPPSGMGPGEGPGGG